MRAVPIRSIVLSLLLAIFATACSPDETTCDKCETVKAYEATCRLELAAGNYEKARNAVENVINTPTLASLDDPAVDQARFCYTTSNSLYQLNKLTEDLQTLLTTVFGLVGGNPLGSPREFAQFAKDYREGRLDPKVQSAISILLGSFTNPIKRTLEENREQLEEIIKNKRIQWKIQHLPIKIAGSEIIDAGGAYDLGEIYLLYGLTRTLLATFYTVEGQDYTITVGPLIDYIIGVTDNPVSQLTTSPGKAIANVIAVIMATSPSFLSLDKQSGTKLMNDAGEGFSEGFGSILKAVEYMQTRKAAVQALHVIEYQRKDDLDYFVLHMKFNNSANPLAFAVDIAKFDGIAIPLQENVLESLANMRDDFADNPGINTNLQRDIFPIIALVTVVLVNSGAFDAIINMALENADQATKSTADQILGILKDNQDLVTTFLVALVPVQTEFDFGHMFKQPGGLRDVFPAWTQPAPGSEGFNEALTEASLVYSYECLDAIKDPLRHESYLCAQSDETADTGHFQPSKVFPEVGGIYSLWQEPATMPTGLFMPSWRGITWTNYSSTNNFGPKWEGTITPDGVNTIIPIIGLKDASMGGVLYLDISSIKSEFLEDTKDGMQLADLKTANASIAEIFSVVQGFLVE